MENKENNVGQQPTKKNRAKSVAKKVLILAAATAFGVWYGKKGFKGMGNDIKSAYNKAAGAVKNAMPKKEQANVEVEVREPRNNEYRGHNHNHGNNKYYNNN
jgi:hypothetical protein